MRPGQALSGSWTVVPPASPSSYGYFDIPVVASFNWGVESEKTARVHLVRPLSGGLVVRVGPAVDVGRRR